MTNWPKISLITAVLNAEKHLEIAIKSILAQNYPNLEYIVIDGGSTDRTLEIIGKYRKYISIFRSESDEGNADAQNKAVRLSTGEVVGFLAADDWLEPGALMHIGKAFADHPEADVVTCSGRSVIDLSNGQYRVDRVLEDEDLDLTVASVLTIAGGNARFMRRSVYDRFGFPHHRDKRGDYFLVNDREFFLRLALGGAQFVRVSELCCTFVGHCESLTFSANPKRTVQMFREYLDIFEDHLYHSSLTPEQRKLFKCQHRKEAVRFFWRAVRFGRFDAALEAAKRGFKINSGIWLLHAATTPFTLAIRSLSRDMRKLMKLTSPAIIHVPIFDVPENFKAS